MTLKSNKPAQANTTITTKQVYFEYEIYLQI